jgi:hypothetical protein
MRKVFLSLVSWAVIGSLAEVATIAAHPDRAQVNFKYRAGFFMQKILTSAI